MQRLSQPLRQSYCYFEVELLSRSRISTLFIVWILVFALSFCYLIVSNIVAFNCVPFCNVSSGISQSKCASLGSNGDWRSTCINFTQRNWSSAGGAFPHTYAATLRQMNRLVIVPPIGVDVDKSAIESVELSMRIFDGNKTHTRSIVPQLALVWFGWHTPERQVAYITIPDDFTPWPSGVQSVSVGFKSNVLGSTPSVAFLSRSPSHVIFDFFCRYLLLIFGSAVFVCFLCRNVQHLQLVSGSTQKDLPDESPELVSRFMHVVALAFSREFFTHLLLQHKVVLVFHLICVFCCDPLAALIAYRPSSKFALFWSLHLIPLIRNVALTVFAVYIMFCVKKITLMGTRRRKKQLLVIIMGIAFLFLFIDRMSIRGPEKGDLPSPTMYGSQKNSVAPISSLCLAIAFGLMFCMHFVVYRRQIVWNLGMPVYTGDLRVFVLWVRVVSGFGLVYILYWTCFYMWVTISLSSIVPLNRICDLNEAFLSVMFSSICLALNMPRCVSPSQAPPNPHSACFCHETIVGYGATEETQALSPAVTLDRHEAWQSIAWTKDHFNFVQQYSVSGFMFATDNDRGAFDALHASVENSRSFFCLETAAKCLGMSFEVYGRCIDGTLFVEHDKPFCETCLQMLMPDCCCSAAVEEPDADTRALVTNEASSNAEPVMDVTRYGYSLQRCVNVKGFQLIVCTYSSERRGEEDSVADPFASHSHVLVAFRGTANVSNLLTDLQITRGGWKEMSTVTNGRAKLHSGFLSAWEALSPFAVECIAGALNILNDPAASVIFTGHSLGAAIAVLAHYSCRAGDRADLLRNRQSYCYVFGMPVVGNNPFATEYDRVCPNTYRIIMENDRVSKMKHCLRKHVGRAVTMNIDGNIIVEPNSVEDIFEILHGVGSGFKNHRLDTYSLALDHVCAFMAPSAHRDFKFPCH